MPDKYHYLRFNAADINHVNASQFSHFLLSFKMLSVSGGQSFFILQGLAYDTSGNAIGAEFDLPVEPHNPATQTLNNRFRGIIKLDKAEMTNNGMDGSVPWFLRPLRFVAQGQQAEYVAYEFSANPFPPGSVTAEIKIAATNFIGNPSPPKSMIL